jgi:hypothetical protein
MTYCYVLYFVNTVELKTKDILGRRFGRTPRNDQSSIYLDATRGRGTDHVRGPRSSLGVG